MTIRLLRGDCRTVLRTLPDASVDSVVTDPPYHLMAHKKGGTGDKSINLAMPHGRSRIGTGFMGMKWDGGDIAHNVEMWAECLRVLKPGGHMLAFSGTRTYHRMACAIEDAGFEIRDQIGWAFGSGFPKSHNGEWGGTALKPAWEPICMARKPLIGTVEANWREHGTGALNIDGCRIAHLSDADRAGATPQGRATAKVGALAGKTQRDGERTEFERADTSLGRWPANLIHDGSDEVLAAFPHTQSGTGTVKRRSSRDELGNTGAAFGAESRPAGTPMIAHGDAGSAARFFYCAKASREDRNAGLDGMPEKPLLWSSGEQNPGSFQSPNTKRAAQNNHPTVKPTDLMRYLCRLVTPPGGTVLDPFMGSGSTGKAAELEGFSFVGIELSAEYIEIARHRIASDAPMFASVEAA